MLQGCQMVVGVGDIRRITEYQMKVAADFVQPGAF